MKNILFAADNHGGARGGLALVEEISSEFELTFFEDDFSCFEIPLKKYDLIILNMIGGTSGLNFPNSTAEKNVKEYMQAGGNFFLLHGATAAFNQWGWWRNQMGLRWVRKNDPDKIQASSHPITSFKVSKTSSNHSLMQELNEVNISNDELYMGLQKVRPTDVLLETHTKEGLFPMCYIWNSDWKGTLASYLPGHRKEVVKMKPNVHNCKAIIKWLLNLHT